MSVFIQAQVRIPYVSGIPEDVSVNTFNFACETDPGPSDFDDLTDALVTMYNNFIPYLSPCLATPSSTVRYYSSDFPPAHPFSFLEEDPLPLDGPSVGNALPQECAICISYSGIAALGGAPTTPPNRRGRIYIGPIDSATIDEDPDLNIARLDTSIATLFATAADTFRAVVDGVATPFQWVVWSRSTGGALTPISKIWCDNEFDTVRRRGTEANYRATFP